MHCQRTNEHTRSKAACSLGFPHSSYSCTVSGCFSSVKTVSTSRNGTWRIAANRKLGRLLMMAPATTPPALKLSRTICPTSVYPIQRIQQVAMHVLIRPFEMRCFMTASQSEMEFCFFSNRPSLCHSRPNSPPPRTWPNANYVHFQITHRCTESHTIHPLFRSGVLCG